jgi:TrmH family RNA methyltransferase
VITSTANESVKYVRSLYRRRVRYGERAFVAEGLRTVEEALKAGMRPAFLLHTSAVLASPRAAAIVSQAVARGVRVGVVSDTVMAAMADTITPSGVLAVLPMSASNFPEPSHWVLILDRVRDPGNLGTILRSALGAGVELVITTSGTVDVYSPKVVRSAMGAHFRLKLWVDQPWGEVQKALGGLDVWVASPEGGDPYWRVDWRRPTALVIGGEAEGVDAEAEQLAAGHVTIPMRSEVESLNAAMAASVLLFEAARQRFQASLA